LNLGLASGLTYSFGDIAINDQGLLVGSGRNSFTNQLELFSVNLAASSLVMTTLSFTDLTFQLAFVGSDLYATSASNQNIYKYNSNTHTLNATGVTYSSQYLFNDLANGRTTTPPTNVPEPATLSLLAGGIALVGRKRRRVQA